MYTFLYWNRYENEPQPLFFVRETNILNGVRVRETAIIQKIGYEYGESTTNLFIIILYLWLIIKEVQSYKFKTYLVYGYGYGEGTTYQDLQNLLN